MDTGTMNTGITAVVAVMALIGVANLVDYGFRTMAQNKADRAESARFRRWGLAAPPRPEEPRDEHLWHL